MAKTNPIKKAVREALKDLPKKALDSGFRKFELWMKNAYGEVDYWNAEFEVGIEGITDNVKMYAEEFGKKETFNRETYANYRRDSRGIKR